MAKHIEWVDSRKNNFVDNKIPGGHEDQGSTGSTIFVARAKYEGGVHPGKYVDRIGDHLIDSAYIAYDGKEIEFGEYQVATGDKTKFNWVRQSGPFNKCNVTLGEPVQAGFEIINNGWDVQDLYVARALVYEDGIHRGMDCGKVAEGSIAKYSLNGKEYTATEYEVLVYTG